VVTETSDSGSRSNETVYRRSTDGRLYEALRQVSVETVNATVTLRGKVDSDEAKAAAASVATAIDGVKGVRNDLQVVPLGDRKMVEASDKDITKQVEGRLAQDAQLRKVDVRADGGTVILKGGVPSIGASARASELAREVPGVRSVKNELTYDSSRREAPRAASRLRLARRHGDAAGPEGQGLWSGPIDGNWGRVRSALKEYQRSSTDHHRQDGR
jgi:hypothetical protein